MCHKVLSWFFYCFHCTLVHLVCLLINTKEKVSFYAGDTQVYVHLTQQNSSAAFERLNRCLDNVKEWMSTGKLKLNPDNTEFVVFGIKKD